MSPAPGQLPVALGWLARRNEEVRRVSSDKELTRQGNIACMDSYSMWGSLELALILPQDKIKFGSAWSIPARCFESYAVARAALKIFSFMSTYHWLSILLFFKRGKSKRKENIHKKKKEKNRDG